MNSRTKWPPMDHLKARLDRDQYDAIKHAFSRKVTLKQGPSGTGKKFACKNRRHAFKKLSSSQETHFIDVF